MLDSASSTGRWRYGVVAMLLHWSIAGLILYQIVVGLSLGEALKASEEAARFAAYEATQTHKALGLTVLALTLLRIVWRLANPAPALPGTMPPLEKLASHLSHLAFYALMLGMPLSGWAMVSTSAEFSMVPTSYFDLFAVPHLPSAPLTTLVEGAGLAEVGRGAHVFHEAHELLAWGAVALLVLHVAAALRHHVMLGDAVLARMVPFLRPRDPDADTPPAEAAGGGRRALAGLVFVAMLGGGVALWLAPAHQGDASAGASALVGDGMEGMAADIPRWSPVMAESRIAFSGENSGSRFEGEFKTWSAEIAFDPDRLEQSRVVVDIETGSAETGVMQYDGSLTSADWLAPEAHPQARFVAENFRKTDAPDGFIADGTLTLRGVEKPLELAFTLSIEGDRAEVAATAEIDRIAYEIGMGADPNAAWVSRVIGLDVTLVAEKTATQ